MSLRQKDYKVGYKRPPQHTQWKKGQCGNPKRQYKRAPKRTVALIDAQFEKQVDMVENGASRRVSVFEAIFFATVAQGNGWRQARHNCPIKISRIRCKAGWPKRHRDRIRWKR
jgi:hypothetical protein